MTPDEWPLQRALELLASTEGQLLSVMAQRQQAYAECVRLWDLLQEAQDEANVLIGELDTTRAAMDALVIRSARQGRP